MIESAIIQHTRRISTKNYIIKILYENDLEDVYFDDLYSIDEYETRTDILKIKPTGEYEGWIIETECEGRSVSEHLNRCDLLTLTLVYLRLQKMIRDFKSVNSKSTKSIKSKTKCCKNTPNCYNCPEKKL